MFDEGAALTHLLLLTLGLVALSGTAVVMFMLQSGRIGSRKIAIGATLLLLLSGAAVMLVAVQQSTARAETLK
jgi:hypothetical protein